MSWSCMLSCKKKRGRKRNDLVLSFYYHSFMKVDEYDPKKEEEILLKDNKKVIPIQTSLHVEIKRKK